MFVCYKQTSDNLIIDAVSRKKLGLLRGMKEKQKKLDVTKQTTHQHHDVKLT